MRNRIVLFAFVVILLLSMVSCAINENKALMVLDDTHTTAIQKDLEIFANGCISDITECIFGVSSGELSADDSKNGIIADLFANADAHVSSVDEATITYTIISPDISDFFRAKADELQSITTTEELRQAIIEYAKTAPQKEYIITLTYAISETGIAIAYDNPEFINAMTGGLIDAYADLYDQYLEGEG